MIAPPGSQLLSNATSRLLFLISQNVDIMSPYEAEFLALHNFWDPDKIVSSREHPVQSKPLSTSEYSKIICCSIDQWSPVRGAIGTVPHRKNK